MWEISGFLYKRKKNQIIIIMVLLDKMLVYRNTLNNIPVTFFSRIIETCKIITVHVIST